MRLFFIILTLFGVFDLVAQNEGPPIDSSEIISHFQGRQFETIGDSLIHVIGYGIQTIDEFQDSIEWLSYVGFLEQAILGKSIVTTEVVQNPKADVRYYPFDCLGNKADQYMDQFIDNLDFDIEYDAALKKNFLSFYSFVEDLQNIKTRFDLAVSVESAKADDNDFGIGFPSNSKEQKVWELNYRLFERLSKKLYNYEFPIPDFEKLTLNGFIKIKAAKAVIGKFAISRDDIGKEISFNDYLWNVEHFENNKLIIKTKNKVFLHPNELLEGNKTFEETRFIQSYDKEGNAIVERSWSEAQYIRGEIWNTYLKFKDQPQELRSALEIITNEDLKNKKDYLYKEFTFAGVLVDKVEFEQIEYLARVLRLKLDYKLRQSSEGSSLRGFGGRVSMYNIDEEGQ